ncbi:MAG: LLM class F420-dependent oxidoreductase [Actinomycetota bacterium]|nr:LLM class F420-dependent oxidoreductase [Actinomycetota bacterium]
MLVGVVFPQTEIGTDVSAIRDYAQAAESLGYSHLLVYDHVLGASIQHRSDWQGAYPYTSENQFHEPFVLFGYLAALTQQLELVTGVIILPQRQTALVAKQVAEVDILSGGRVRLGVGIGWNPVEYEGLNEDFRNRGKRIEEQIVLLRELWSSTAIDFTGRWHRIPDAGINPLPVQRPVPIWLGGHAGPVLERVGRLADGWFPQMKPGDAARAALDKIRASAEAAGRDPGSIGIEARLNLRGGEMDSWRQQIDGWRELGATHLGINTMGMGLSPVEQIAMIEKLKRELGL